MGPPASARPRGPGAGLVPGLVLLDDRRANTAAALAHLVSALPRPCPGFRAPLTARAGTCPAPRSGGADLARVAGALARAVPQHVQCTRRSRTGFVERERNCLLTLDLAIV